MASSSSLPSSPFSPYCSSIPPPVATIDQVSLPYQIAFVQIHLRAKCIDSTMSYTPHPPDFESSPFKRAAYKHRASLLTEKSDNTENEQQQTHHDFQHRATKYVLVNEAFKNDHSPRFDIIKKTWCFAGKWIKTLRMGRVWLQRLQKEQLNRRVKDAAVHLMERRLMKHWSTLSLLSID